MDITEYRNNIVETIKLNSELEFTSDKEEFVSYVTNLLIDAEEFDEYIPVHFEGIGKKSKKLQVDGYGYNELDDVLYLFVVPDLVYEKDINLTATDAEKYFNRVKAFIEESAYVKEYAEESSPGFGLAVDIQDRFNKVHKYSIYLLTDMVISKSIKEISANKINNIYTDYHIWDITRFHKLEESANGKEDLVINFEEFGYQGIPFLPASKTDDYTAYLCNISGEILAKLYNTYGGRLLEGNVRSFLQTKGKVNKGIRVTILNNPDLFFAYNNGIAATASKITTNEHDGINYITQIESLQIVNGGQTTASLAMALQNDKKDGSEVSIKKIFVPMKLSVVTPLKAEELIPNISKYANSQNKVSDADLWSNHPFHIRMEEFSRRIVTPSILGKQYGTHWYYERANGQYKQETYKSSNTEKKKFEMLNPKGQMFNKTDLAKIINIYLKRPHIASAGGQKAFSKFAEWVVGLWDKSDTNFNESFFKKVVSLTIMYKTTDKIVRTQSWFNSYKANIVAYSLSKIFQIINDDYSDYMISFKSIWQKQMLSEAWIKQIEDISLIMYNHLISDDRLIENVTEWAKREACWDWAKKIKIELNPDFIEELQLKDIEKSNEKYAKRDQKLTNNVNKMMEVANFGLEFWRNAIEWGVEHNVLTPIDLDYLNLLNKVDKGLFPSEKQCLKIMKILEKLRMEGYSK